MYRVVHRLFNVVRATISTIILAIFNVFLVSDLVLISSQISIEFNKIPSKSKKVAAKFISHSLFI